MLRRSDVARRLLSRISSGAKHSVVLLRGDGIGPECVDAACRIIDAAGVQIEWREYEFGASCRSKTGKFFDESVLAAFDHARVIFKGPITIPPGTSPKVDINGRSFTSANQALRKLFNLFANVRPSRTLPNVPSRFEHVDLVVIRENTEDLYTGEERWVDDQTVEGVKRISKTASTKIAEFAFQYARKHDRASVTAVHKANVCPLADGLFLTCARDVAANYQGIEYSEQLADSLLQPPPFEIGDRLFVRTKLVLDPTTSDVLLCPNLFGDLISDLAAGLTGSLGLACSGQYGATHALFEPAHGSAPDLAGRGLANPTSQILTSTMMLRHLGEGEAADRIDTALMRMLQDPTLTTKDIGGDGSTEKFTTAIINALDRAPTGTLDSSIGRPGDAQFKS